MKLFLSISAVCPENSTSISYFSTSGMFIGSLEADWPESPVGNVSIQCPCGTIGVLTAIRVCVQDAFNQAHWESPDVTQCLLLNFDLCRISQVVECQ